MSGTRPGHRMLMRGRSLCKLSLYLLSETGLTRATRVQRFRKDVAEVLGTHEFTFFLSWSIYLSRAFAEYYSHLPGVIDRRLMKSITGNFPAAMTLSADKRSDRGRSLTPPIHLHHPFLIFVIFLASSNGHYLVYQGVSFFVRSSLD